MTLNKIFYDGTLDATTYQAWLADMGVRFVALPAAPLDDSATAEAALLHGGLPYLTLVWQNHDWRVWGFDASPGLITGAGALTQIAPDSFTVEITRPGDVVVRMRASSHWAVPTPGCVTADPNGWTVLRNLPVGTTKVTQALSGTPCA
jgi:hypothetical protein